MAQTSPASGGPRASWPPARRHVVAKHKGTVAGRRGDELTVDRRSTPRALPSSTTSSSPRGAGLAGDPGAIARLRTAYRHLKPIAVWGDGVELLAAAAIETDEPGVIVVDKPVKRFGPTSWQRLALHRRGIDWPRTPPATSRRRPVTTGIDLILADHRRVDELFTEFDASHDPDVLGRILEMLTDHDQAEHAALYPLARHVLGDDELLSD